MLEDAVEHGEDDVLLGVGEAAQALELALEFGRGAAFPGRRAGRCPGDAEQRIGGHAKEGGERGHEHDGEPEAADLVVGAEFLTALGRDVEIVVRPAPRSRKRGRLHVAAA